MNSTSWRRIACAALFAAASTAQAFNHERIVPPRALGTFNVACSNLEQDEGLMARIGGTPTDFWEGNEVGGQSRYITEVLAHPETAVTFEGRAPLKPWLYPQNFGRNVQFAAIVCHPTPASNSDAHYPLPGSDKVVPHMQPAGQAPKLISAAEYRDGLCRMRGNCVDFAAAAPAPTGVARMPLLVYSHGLGGSPVGKGYIDTLVQFAAQGYIVASVFHADARFSRIRVEDLGDAAYALAFFPFIVEMQLMRPVALKAMTDALLSRGGFSGAIDTERIAGFGASLGGQAMAHLVGADITSSLAGSCDESVRDPRLRAVVGYVPYAGQSFLPAFCEGQSGAAGVNRPYLAIAGTADTTAPLSQARRALNQFQSSRFLVELEGGQHELRPEDAGDVLTWSLEFLDAYLDFDRAAMGRFIRMAQVVGGRVDHMTVDVHVPFATIAGDSRAVEFYHPGLDHYFIAAGDDEIQFLQAGGAGAWETTGRAFKAGLRAPVAPGDKPVCRFYGRPAGGPNSHFFTADAPECAFVKSAGGWFYEGIGFYIATPDATGACPDGMLGVNRAYNNGFVRNDSNHRFTTSDSTIREMLGRGWAYEGIQMCSRP